MAAAQEALAATSQASSAHLRTVCEFSSPSTPPLRAKVDRQSFDELKPGVDSAFAIIDWFGELQKAFVALLLELANSADPPSASALTALVEALDCCIVLENQFAGWSQCVNRFSWFKRTFTQIRREVAAEVDCDKLSRDLSRFQTFIGAHHARPRARVPVSRVPRERSNNREILNARRTRTYTIAIRRGHARRMCSTHDAR